MPGFIKPVVLQKKGSDGVVRQQAENKDEAYWDGRYDILFVFQYYAFQEKVLKSLIFCLYHVFAVLIKIYPHPV